MGSIMLHREHGVNPFVPSCFVCGESKNEIWLPGAAYKGDAGQDLNGKCIDKTPCDKCKEIMKHGIFIIEVRNGESGENPFRTGRLTAIREEAFRRIFKGEAAEVSLKSRMCFMDQETTKACGLDQAWVSQVEEKPCA